jgi:hypothetical protein
MKHKRNASLSDLMQDATNALADYARWPHIEARRETAEREIAILRDALRGFDPVIPNAVLLKITADFLSEGINRAIPKDGWRAALLMLAELRATETEKTESQ